MNFVHDPSLVLYLPFHKLDGGSFMSRDAYGHLSTVTGAIWTPYGRSFDGVDDMIQIVPATMPTTVTIMIWCYLNSYQTTPPGGWGNLVFLQAVAAGKWPISLRMWGLTGEACIHIDYSGGGSKIITGNTVVPLNEWTFIAGIVDSGNLKASIFLNGYLDDEDSMTDTPHDSIDRVKIGGDARYSDCMIGTVFIFNRAFASPEVKKIYQATKWRYR